MFQTETKEAQVLPDKYDILKEKATEQINEAVETFEPAKLNPVKTAEPDPLQMLRQDSIKKEVADFDKDSLIHTEVRARLCLITRGVYK